MNYYPRELIDELINSFPLCEVAKYYGDKPKGHGKNLGIHCPCCNRDQTHCHTNNPRYGKSYLFHCKSPQCGAKGSTIDYIRYKEGHGTKESIRFQDAVKKLIEIANYPMEQLLKDYRLENEDFKKHQKILEIAIKFYSQKKNPYLQQRGISIEVQNKNKIGFSLGNCLRVYMNEMGFDDEVLESLGLFYRLKNDKLVERFRNRVIFPIFNRNKRLVDIYGRSIHTNDPLPHLYLRGQNIAYGFECINPSRPIIWVESLINKLSLEEIGYSNIVAVGGAYKFSSYHINLCRDLGIKEHYFLFDGDPGGRDGALKAGEQLIKIGCSVKIGRLPEGFDVNDLLCKGDLGIEQIRQTLLQAQSFEEEKSFALLEQIDIKIIYKYLDKLSC